MSAIAVEAPSSSPRPLGEVCSTDDEEETAGGNVAFRRSNIHGEVCSTDDEEETTGGNVAFRRSNIHGDQNFHVVWSKVEAMATWAPMRRHAKHVMFLMESSGSSDECELSASSSGKSRGSRHAGDAYTSRNIHPNYGVVGNQENRPAARAQLEALQPDTSGLYGCGSEVGEPVGAGPMSEDAVDEELFFEALRALTPEHRRKNALLQEALQHNEEGGSLWSIGTALHVTGNCKMCHRVHHRQGCERGEDCRYCHVPHTQHLHAKVGQNKRLYCKVFSRLVHCHHCQDPPTFFDMVNTYCDKSEYLRGVLTRRFQDEAASSSLAS